MPLQPITHLIGSKIRTPKGDETILSFDDAQDLAHTGHGNNYRLEDILGFLPEDRSTAAVEDWLEVDWILVSSRNLPCSCSCGTSGGCDYLVTIRGRDQTVVHQSLPGCTCGTAHSCCGYRLNPSSTVATSVSWP